MTDFRQRPNTPGFEVDDEVDLLFARGNPNPDRVGCLPIDVLESLARKERSIADPGFEHLAQCSNCFREYRGFQQAEARTRAARMRRLRLAAAAAVLIIGGVATWATMGRRTADAPNASTIDRAVQTARLDLRPLSVSRGPQSTAEPDPLRLTRARIVATLLLPVGAEPGDYEVGVLDEARVPRATAKGTAKIIDFVTTLEAEPLDTTTLSPGAYQLGVRRPGGEWQLFPARVE